ncbi:MAG TPA: c-type cytochrome [Vicinamibacterales bacterium]|nr:c-type cytochrome [Vicinamibacterales bacterium]
MHRSVKGLLTLATAVTLTACATPAPETAAAPVVDPVERGAYLVSTMGCHDCHTPWQMGPNGPEPDMTRALSGHPEGIEITKPPALTEQWNTSAAATFTAWTGPWGMSFTANLTPDQNTGLGIWTEEMFVNAIRLGKHMGTSRDILPPMPWQVYRNLTDDDLKAVFAYLRTITPISNHVPDPLTPEQVAALK